MFDLHKPCSDCPFLIEGGVRLRRSRIEEITDYMLSDQGKTFSCHKTTESDEDGCRVSTGESQHCAGALIFALKNDNYNQPMRMAARMRLWDPRKMKGDELVFNTVEEMLETALE